MVGLICFQMIMVAGRIITLIALKKLFGCVPVKDMPVQIALEGSFVITLDAMEGFFFCMQKHMNLQMISLSGCIIALVALEWFYSIVPKHVIF